MKRVLPDILPEASPYADPGFSATVINWQRREGRHALPWQQTRDAYRVWLSEIMLQQTQVAAVIPYYQHFLAQFPTVEALAAAPSEAVMACWSGLGYYTRARNLHRCAQIVVTEFGGRFPDQPALLETLPGIGRSTAAAIAAFSYGCRAAILDGNVKRVFARVFGIEGYPGAKAVEDKMWERAVALLPEEGIESYTQGLMDLGATMCMRSRPACNKCPFAGRCVAYNTHRVAELPHRKPKKAIPDKFTTMLVMVSGHAVLLEKRPEKGIWGGLLSLPDCGFEEAPVDMERVAARMQALLVGSGDQTLAHPDMLAPFTHVFTHFRLHVQPVCLRLASEQDVAAPETMQWHDLDAVASAPLPAPVKKLLLSVARQDLFSV